MAAGGSERVIGVVGAVPTLAASARLWWSFGGLSVGRAVMREWWANVYANKVGNRAVTRYEAQVMNGEHGGIPNGAGYRIHVRLKPEGAPKRYASEANRRAWEQDPETCRQMERFGYRVYLVPGQGISAGRIV